MHTFKCAQIRIYSHTTTALCCACAIRLLHCVPPYVLVCVCVCRCSRLPSTVSCARKSLRGNLPKILLPTARQQTTNNNQPATRTKVTTAWLLSLFPLCARRRSICWTSARQCIGLRISAAAIPNSSSSYGYNAVISSVYAVKTHKIRAVCSERKGGRTSRRNQYAQLCSQVAIIIALIVRVTAFERPVRLSFRVLVATQRAFEIRTGQNVTTIKTRKYDRTIPILILSVAARLQQKKKAHFY